MPFKSKNQEIWMRINKPEMWKRWKAEEDRRKDRKRNRKKKRIKKG